MKTEIIDFIVKIEKAFISPQTLEEELGKGSFTSAFSVVIGSAILIWLIISFGRLPYGGIFLILLQPLDVMSLFLLGGLAIPSVIIYWFMLSFSLYISCKILGGRGNEDDHAYISALITSPLIILYFVSSLLYGVNRIQLFTLGGIDIFLPLLFAYGVYATAVSMNVVHRIGIKWALVSVIISIIILQLIQRYIL